MRADTIENAEEGMRVLPPEPKRKAPRRKNRKPRSFIARHRRGLVLLIAAIIAFGIGGLVEALMHHWFKHLAAGMTDGIGFAAVESAFVGWIEKI